MKKQEFEIDALKSKFAKLQYQFHIDASHNS